MHHGRDARPGVLDEPTLPLPQRPCCGDRLERRGPVEPGDLPEPVAGELLERRGVLLHRVLHRRDLGAAAGLDPDADQLGELLFQGQPGEHGARAFGVGHGVSLSVRERLAPVAAQVVQWHGGSLLVAG